MKKIKNITVIVGLIIISVVAAGAQIAQGGAYTLNQSVIASGGGTSSDAAGTVYQVSGTAGQPAAGTIAYGGAYVLKNGFWTAPPLAPTTAEVSVSGRVLAAGGKGLVNARVLITDARGQTWTVLTGAFGNFHLDGLIAGETLVIAVSSKRFTFAPQLVPLTGSVSGLTFAAQ